MHGHAQKQDMEQSCCRFFLFLLFFSINGGVPEAWPKGSVTRYYNFKVQTASITKLCKTSTIVTVNGMYPGPMIYAREDDRVVVKVTNLTPYNISIHWHGVRQRLTVHDPLIIYPKQGVSYPFEPPIEEHVIVLGEYWLRDIQDLERHVTESGGGPPGSDAYIVNGYPGPLHNCSRHDVYTITVTKGKKYLFRIINAALNMEHFFGVANHTMTVVEADGEYTKPFKTPFLMLTPGQTYNVLIRGDQPIGNYYMAMAPYMPAKDVPFLNKTSYAILHYVTPPTVARKSSMVSHEPMLTNVDDTESVQAFSDQVRSLYPNEHWSPIDVPLKLDKSLFFTIGLNVLSCDSPDPDRCQGPKGGIFSASVNNITFRKPMVSLLNAYYNNLEGYYSTNFPDKPEKMYDFVNEAPNNIGVDTQAAVGTQVSVLEYGWAVQVIFQDAGTVGTENHPIHLHGFSFCLLGTGLGNLNSSTAVLNLYDPPYRNTVGVPVGGWAVIRFRADNPGVWFMHCHLDVHTTWGLSMAFLVKNGKGRLQTLPPPPPDLPLC